jgi:nucleoid-associated protein YgaU
MRLNFPVPLAISKNILEKSDHYIVKRGDTLEQIALRFYGDYKLWGLLYLLNKDTITLPENLKESALLRIPKKHDLSLPPNYSFALFNQAYIE